MTTTIFYSQSCPSCNAMKANLQELLPQATWHDVEADDWALATTLDIWGVPAIVTQAEDGSVLKSHVGYLSKAKIREWT